MEMPTIRDVAKRAGVAPITVSRVINNSDYVSDKTRARVEKAIDELGYIPNLLGPSLRFKQTHTLALVLTDITNPFWTKVTRGVEDTASKSGYNVILCNTDESETKQKEYLLLLLKRQVDGILLVPTSSDHRPIETIQNQNVPVVVLDRYVPEIQVDIVRADSENGAYRLVQHLLALEHQHIAVLSGPQQVSTARDRVAGYRRAMTEAGLSDVDKRIFWGQFTQPAGYEMAQQALQTHPRPTAIFAANNFIAAGAMQALHEIGLHVPEDAALVTFDNASHAWILNPFFTAAIQPAYEMGCRACELLLDRLSDCPPPHYQEIVLPVEVNICQSSGPVRAGISR